jgi:hypothetical protein
MLRSQLYIDGIKEHYWNFLIHNYQMRNYLKGNYLYLHMMIYHVKDDANYDIIDK